MNKKYPSCTWFVHVECRQIEAIGIFEWKQFEVRAKNEELAVLYAVEDAGMDGYETRGIGQRMRIA